MSPATTAVERPQRRVRDDCRPLIVHIIDELQVGGAQTHLVTMIREARRRYDLDHFVIGLFGDGPIARELEALGVGVEALDLRPLFARRRFPAAAEAIGRRLRDLRADVVEAHLTWSRLLGLYAAWRAKAPTRIGFEQGDVYLDSWKFRAANFVGQGFAHRIVVCSEALGEWNRRTHGVRRGRLEVLHNCVDLDRFRPSASRRDPEFGFSDGTTIFAAVGTLGRGVNKRVDVAVRAIAAARESGRDVGLVVCGDGEQRADLEALAESLGVAEAVRFLGMRGDVRDVLAGCDAFCHAAPFEPFGIVCIEAMAMQLPVIVPDSGGIVEAVEDGVSGLVYPRLDHASLARAMSFLHDRPDDRRRMGRAARLAVEARFSSAAYIDRLYDLYGLSRHAR